MIKEETDKHNTEITFIDHQLSWWSDKVNSFLFSLDMHNTKVQGG